MTTKTVDVSTNKVARFETLVRDASRLEVEDAFFNTASAVLLPDVPTDGPPGNAVFTPFANGLLLAEMGVSQPEFTKDMITVPFDPDTPGGGDKAERDNGLHVIIAALRFLEKNPAAKMVIAGHTDRAGDDAFNLRLSKARGNSVLAVLEGKRADFVASCTTLHAPEDDPIVLRFAARTQGFQTEPLDSSEATPGEIREFQREFNDKFKAKIRVTGVVNDETHGAYFDLYQVDLEKTAGGKDALQKLRSNIRFVDSAHKVLGFGERFPRENPGQDGLRSQVNRRVEFLFFAPPRLPNVSAPDVGDQIFKRKLFTFTALNRNSLVSSAKDGDTVKGSSTKMSIVSATLVPDDPLTLTIPKLGVRDPNDPYAFLVQFDSSHPDEGVGASFRGNTLSVTQQATRSVKKGKPTPPPPGPLPNS